MLACRLLEANHNFCLNLRCTATVSFNLVRDLRSTQDCREVTLQDSSELGPQIERSERSVIGRLDGDEGDSLANDGVIIPPSRPSLRGAEDGQLTAGSHCATPHPDAQEVAQSLEQWISRETSRI